MGLKTLHVRVDFIRNKDESKNNKCSVVNEESVEVFESDLQVSILFHYISAIRYHYKFHLHICIYILNLSCQS